MAKFLKVMEWIVKDKLLESIQIFQPTEPSFEAVTLVHNRDYVDSFIKGSLPFNEMRRTGFHWSEGLVKRCFLEVGMLLCGSSLILTLMIFHLSGGLFNITEHRKTKNLFILTPISIGYHAQSLKTS